MDVCVLIIGLVILLIVLWIIAKVIGWGATVAGGVGNYRTGKAMKQISQQGLMVRQPEQHQIQPNQQAFRQSTSAHPAKTRPRFCDQCGTQLRPDSMFCPHCGRRL